MHFDKLPITVLIMTQNEEENVKYAIESVINDFDQIIIADSYSSDKTVELCKQYPLITIYQNKFEGWANQRNWMLTNCNIRNEIVFFLDADEYVIPQFIDELKRIIKSDTHFESIYLFIRYIFLGSNLKYAYGHPKIKRIFRKTDLSFTGAGAREYANKEGVAFSMQTHLVHHDRKPIAYWIEKHNRNADREAIHYQERERTDFSYTSTLPWRLRTKILIRNSIWNRLPLLVRPFLYFVYRYIFQLGILDGRPGLIYCYLHAFWYQSLIDIKILEKKVEERNVLDH